MTSKVPSGGMNVIDLSRSNLPSLTHWWNLMSSIWIPFYWATPPGLSAFSLSLTKSLSLIPNLHSGMPDNWVFMITCPTTSDFKTVPLFDNRTFTFSMMSINSSLYLYFMPSALQEILPVAWIVIYFSFSILVSILFSVILPWVIYIFNRSGSSI